MASFTLSVLNQQIALKASENAELTASLQQMQTRRKALEKELAELREAELAKSKCQKQIQSEIQDMHASVATLQKQLAVTKQNLDFISLINNDGRRKDGIGQRWRDNWMKCFDREGMKSEAEVRVGDTGSVGIGYWINQGLDTLITEDDEESVRKILATKPTVGSLLNSERKKVENSVWPGCSEKPGNNVGKQSIKSVVQFYRLSQMPNGTRFGLKRGTKAMWVVEKIGGYYYAPRVENESSAVISKWQRTENYFAHRFSFRVIAIVPEVQSKMHHHLELIKNHEVTF